jgi:hypothetical protein
LLLLLWPAQFPKSLEGDVVRQIHHSTLRKDDLINKIHASLKQGSPGADKENGQQDSPAAAPSSSQAAPVTKKLLTQFLIYVSTGQLTSSATATSAVLHACQLASICASMQRASCYCFQQRHAVRNFCACRQMARHLPTASAPYTDQRESTNAAPANRSTACACSHTFHLLCLYKCVLPRVLCALQAADKVKPGVWICKEQWVKQYGLSTELPQGVQPPAAEPASA